MKLQPCLFTNAAMVTLLSVSVPHCFTTTMNDHFKREQLVLKTGRKLNGDDDVDLFNA